MRIFIAGPVDGVPNNRLKRFDQLKKYFESRGYEIITEIDVPTPELEKDVERLIDKCDKGPDLVSWLILSMIKFWTLANCDALFLLSGWQECHTSIILFVIAKKLGLPVYVDDGLAIKLANEDKIKSWFEKQMEKFPNE